MRGGDQAPEDHLVLIGHPPVAEFLGMATVQAVDAWRADQRQLIDEGMAAKRSNHRPDRLLAGFADRGLVVPIPKQPNKLVAELESDRIFQRSFRLVRTGFGMVEIDRLIPLQKVVKPQAGCKAATKVVARLDSAFSTRYCLDRIKSLVISPRDLSRASSA